MAERIFSLTHNQQPLIAAFAIIGPGELKGEVLEPAQFGVVSASLAVFKTPLQHTSLSQQLEQYENQTVPLGELPTLIASAGSIALSAELDNQYDIFCMAEDEDGSRFLYDGGRYVVTENSKYEKDSEVTFDEAKFLGFAALGLGDEQAKKVMTKVVPMTAWSTASPPRRMVIAGFELSDPECRADFKPGITVADLGKVNFYHGRTAAETRALAGLDA